MEICSQKLKMALFIITEITSNSDILQKSTGTLWFTVLQSNIYAAQKSSTCTYGSMNKPHMYSAMCNKLIPQSKDIGFVVMTFQKRPNYKDVNLLASKVQGRRP